MHHPTARKNAARTLPCALALGLLSACGYTSQYQAPADGRARVVWGADNDPVVELSGSLPDTTCAVTLQQVTGYHDMQTTQGSVDLPSAQAQGGYPLAISGGYGGGYGGGYWVPRYYGPQIIVLRPGFAPLFPRPPLFSPSLAITEAILRSRGPSGGIGRFSSPGISSGSRGGGGSGVRGGGGGSSGGRLDGAAAVLVALVVMVLPAIDIGLAAARPESSSKSARAIDLVNAYNDLSRSPGAPCSTFTAPPNPDTQPELAPGGAQ